MRNFSLCFFLYEKSLLYIYLLNCLICSATFLPVISSLHAQKNRTFSYIKQSDTDNLHKNKMLRRQSRSFHELHDNNVTQRVVKFKWSAQRFKQNCFMYSTNFISTKLHYNFPSLLQTTHMYTNILHTHYLFWNYVIVKCRWFLVAYVKILIPSLVIYEDNVFHRKNERTLLLVSMKYWQ